jgi:hypothetical protein
MEYRKRRGIYRIWHFCRNCSRDPQYQYDVQYTKPEDGELCEECQKLAKQKDCAISAQEHPVRE